MDSVIRLYHIQPESPIPPEHPSSFLEIYKNIPHYSYSTNNTLIAPTIHTFNTQIYEKLGTNEDFEISWTNLFGTGKDVVDEILVEIYQNDDHWVDVRVYIPSATICVLGKGVDEFNNDFLPSIKQKV